MFKMSEYSFVAAALCLGLASLLYLAYAVSGLRAGRLQAAGASFGTSPSLTFAGSPLTRELGRYASIIGWLALATLTASLIFRTIYTHHGPFSNMYEFSVAFAWGILAAYYWFERKYGQRILAVIALPVALGMLLYAITIPATVEPLVPALQNNLLLTVHVAVAIIAYGSFTVGFGAALLYLIQPPEGRWNLPKPKVLEEIGYRAIVIGFPFLTLTVILGAVWADVAWGKYWSWDPKETASLVTWLIYATYLHARVVRGWRGKGAAGLLVLGFFATLFTYFGNLFFVSLHSYAGLGK